MQLYSLCYPDDAGQSETGQAPVIIIPGLFGSTTNWRSFAKKLSETRPVIVIDQRNHGRSPHQDSHSYADMVDDLRRFIDARGLERVILCGHSMGGKVAMAFALRFPERLEKLLVLDIAPVGYQHSHAPFLEALMQLDLSSLGSRGEADRTLQSAIPDLSTRLFLLQSLSGSAGSFEWRINAPVLHAYMSQITAFPRQDFEGVRSSLPAAFIFGEASDYVPPYKPQIRDYFINATFHGIASAGHWLHADKPDELLGIMKKVIANGEKSD